MKVKVCSVRLTCPTYNTSSDHRGDACHQSVITAPENCPKTATTAKSLPPSADNQEQREARRKPAKREKGKRNKGKQPGAPGAHLERVAEPDRIIDHAPSECRGCGGDLSDAEITGIESRQVFDLPDRRAEVTDHRAEKRRCGCGCETTAGFPPEAIAPTCWGPKVRAVAVYLLVRPAPGRGRTTTPRQWMGTL